MPEKLNSPLTIASTSRASRVLFTPDVLHEYALVHAALLRNLDDSGCVQERPAQTFVQGAGFIGQDGYFICQVFFGKSATKARSEAAGLPLRPRAPSRVRVRVQVRVRPEVGLIWADV